MILPTKRIPSEKCLLQIGGEILRVLDEPKTISRLWHQVKQRHVKTNKEAGLTFEWFSLALSMLYSVNLITLKGGQIHKDAL